MNNELKNNSKTSSKSKYYVRTPLIGNEFKVCNELTDDVIAIFFTQQNALTFMYILNNQNK